MMSILMKWKLCPSENLLIRVTLALHRYIIPFLKSKLSKDRKSFFNFLDAWEAGTEALRLTDSNCMI